MSAAATRELCFPEPCRAIVRSRELAPPGQGEVQIQNRLSALSMGTELSVFRGEIHEDLPLAATPSGAAADEAPGFRFPLCYGYACVGRVTALGPGESEENRPLVVGDRVFAFHHHADHFNCTRAAVRKLPDWLSDERALFLPNMETAVTLILDAAPRMGEIVGLWGLGTVGILTLSLLLQHPVAAVHAFDPDPDAQAKARELAGMLSSVERERLSLGGAAPSQSLDLAFELSSVPAALQAAIDGMQVEGRVVVGSWYGQRTVALDLGRHFHRARLQLLSSQVSRLPGCLGPSWTFDRRWALVDAALRRIPAESLIDARTSLDALPQWFADIAGGGPRPRQLVVEYA